MFFKKNYKNDLYYTAHTTVWIWATKARGKSELLTCFICPHYTQLRRYELRIRKIVLYGSLGKIVYHGLIHFFFIFLLLSFLVSCCTRISYPRMYTFVYEQESINLIEKLELIQVIIYEEFVFMIYIYVRFQFPYKKME